MSCVKKNGDSLRWHRASLVLLGLFIFVGLYTIRDYGMAWDETFRFQGGDAKLSYYQALLEGEPVEAESDVYPGLFDVPLAWAHQAFPEWGTRSEKGHVWGFCFGFLGLISIWRISVLIGGDRAGFWALLLLATLPRYYGHLFMNPKDIPLAGTYACALWMLLRVFQQWPAPSWRSVSLLGLVAGLSMSTRIAGFLVLCYFGLFVGVLLACRYIMDWREGRAVTVAVVASDAWYWLRHGALSGLIAFGVLFVFWPRLHQNPLAQVDSAATTVQNYEWSQNILMEGVLYPASDLPVYYTLYWLGTTLPDGVLVLFGLGLMLAIVECLMLRRGRSIHFKLNRLLYSLVLFSVLFPLCYIMWTRPVLYDGMRHFLFVVPPIACVAALALEWLLRVMDFRGWQWVKRAVLGVVGVSIVVTLVDLVQLHPYQYVYFNHISGGLPAAYNHRDTDYWGLSYREAAEWLNANVPTESEGGLPSYKVLQRNAPWMLEEFLDDRFEVVFDPNQANLYVAITRFNLHLEYPHLKVVHVVHRKRVPLCFILQSP